MTNVRDIRFTCGDFDDDLLPERQALLNCLDRIGQRQWRSALGYCGSKGSDELRDTLADTLLAERGIECTRENIILTNGALHAVSILGLMLVQQYSGATVAVEMPGYFGFRKTLRMLGLRVLPLPVDDEGARPDTEILSQSHAALLTPRHQFPTNVTMSLARRAAFRELAEQGKCLLVEDDYSSNFDFQGVKKQPLSAGRQRRGLIYVGSFSKNLSPGLRQGYMVAEPEVVECLSVVRWRMDRHSPELLQLMLAQLIRSGEYQAAVERTVESYRCKWLAMRAALEEHLGFFPQSTGGLSFWLPVQTTWESLQAIASHSERLGVRLTTGLECFDHPPRFGSLRLGYTCADVDLIDIGVQRLAQSLLHIIAPQ